MQLSRVSRAESPAPPRRAGAGAGFTLIELMVTIALVGILASSALPDFIKLVHKAKRTEAWEALRAVYQMQVEYQAEQGVYADTFDELGFEMPAGQRIDERTIQAPYYTYTMTALSLGDSARANFRALATGDIDPSDPVLDILMIENRLTVLDGSN